MRFLLEGERSYVGSTQLYHCLKKLGIDPPPLPPLPYIFSGEELSYYLDSLEIELRKAPQGIEDYDYAVKVLKTLRKWADSGLIVHVVS